MKRYTSWRKLLVLALVLALGLTASLQASEDVSDNEIETEVILEDTETEVTPEMYAEPAAGNPESEAGILTVDNIAQVPTTSIPDGANAVSEAEQDEQGESQTSNTKVVEFYLDWNGIDGLFGKCLTCTREFAEDATPMFTAEDAAVYGLNFKKAYEEEFDKKTPTERWAFLSEKWAEEPFNGYTFLGWSTVPTGGELIKADTPVENGMSFYAYWTKGGESNETFQRVDPEAGPLEHIRIVAGAGTSFLSGTLHASKHATTGSSLAVNLFCTPVRADIRNVTWSVAVSNSVTPNVLFGSAKKAETVTVTAGETVTVGAVQVKAEGCSLTITSNDNNEHVITVSATAESSEGQQIASPTDATLSFAHSWDAGRVTKDADCVTKGSEEYSCTVCGVSKTVEIPALEHVYNKNKNSNTAEKTYYKVETIKEPTCTEKGENKYTYYCLRCGKGEKVESGPVPALGHAWSETVETPASCNKNTTTRSCTRCGLQEVSLVPAYNPGLHEWKETNRYHETCMSDIVYEQCEVCRETRSRTEAADNPDRHSYAFESRVSNDCYWVTYTFKCVHGCGSTQVTLKREENHNWGGWTTSASLDRTTGMMKRVRTRKCSRCGKEEKEDLGSIAGEPKASVEETEKQTERQTEAQTETNHVVIDGNSAPVTQPMSYTAGNAVAAAVAQAAPSTATASEGKAGWKKSGKKKYYLTEDGKKKTGWQKIDGKKYYFGKDGVMKTGWQLIKGKKYYFGKNGVMRTGKQKIGKKTYNFGKNGVLK